MDMTARQINNGNTQRIAIFASLMAILVTLFGWGYSWKSLDSKADTAKTLAASTVLIAEKAADASIVRDEKLEKRIMELEKMVAQFQLFMSENNKAHDRIEKGLDRLYNKQVSVRKQEPDFMP